MMEEINNLKEKAIEDLREGDYIISDDEIIFTETGLDFFKIEITPWTKIRNITYTKVSSEYPVNIHMAVWETQSGGIYITLKAGIDGENVYNYLVKKFKSALIKKK